ncbi:hypothetical protein ENBRE01_3280 [Enteropsectra breve]|nr:hypothetical protein ENBRE01_3280 [Enteropsectra breve]
MLIYAFIQIPEKRPKRSGSKRLCSYSRSSSTENDENIFKDRTNGQAGKQKKMCENTKFFVSSVETESNELNKSGSNNSASNNSGSYIVQRTMNKEESLITESKENDTETKKINIIRDEVSLKNEKLALENSHLKHKLTNTILEQEKILQQTVETDMFVCITYKQTIECIDANIKCIEQCLETCREIKRTVESNRAVCEKKVFGDKTNRINYK